MRPFAFFAAALLLVLVACGTRQETETLFSTATSTVTTSSAICDSGREAPLLDAVLAHADLDRSTFGITISEILFGDEFTLPLFPAMLQNPAEAECFTDIIAESLDQYAGDGPFPVAQTITHGAWLGGRDFSDYLGEQHAPAPSFDTALAAMCEASGGSCGIPDGMLAPEAKRELAPILWAFVGGVRARAEMDRVAEATGRSPAWWHQNGGNIMLSNSRISAQWPDPDNVFDRAFLWDNRLYSMLYGAAADIAFAIENADWDSFRKEQTESYTLKTPAGWIIIAGEDDDTYYEDGREILLLIDTGGNDTHLDDIATNRSPGNPVSIALDLAGSDTYAYRTVRTDFDDVVSGILPADRDGRFDNGISASGHFRQGAGRYGIAMLFDFGEGDDHYQSLRGSQGYAHLGVGVLFDGGGDNFFFAEEASQGFGQFGMGILVAGGEGNDEFYSFVRAQGSAFAGGVGIFFDGGGEDVVVCNVGDVAYGGHPLYGSLQVPGRGNDSFCQGAGRGLRTTLANPTHSMAGGVGVFRKQQGNGTFQSSVFSQGVGFWRGIGVFSVGEGNHTLGAVYYAQGASAHFGVGVASIGEGDSVFNESRPPVNVMLGAGHDIGLGVFIKEGGEDIYHIPSLGAGASNCGGAGFFVDTGGDDTYIALSERALGMGNTTFGSDCLKEVYAYNTTLGIFLDAGGVDSYTVPKGGSRPLPGDGILWEYRKNNLFFEHGAGLDGEGESGYGK